MLSKIFVTVENVDGRYYIFTSAPIPEGHALVIGPSGKALLVRPDENAKVYLSVEDGELMCCEMRRP